jgi:hypothetical protein
MLCGQGNETQQWWSWRTSKHTNSTVARAPLVPARPLAPDRPAQQQKGLALDQHVKMFLRRQRFVVENDGGLRSETAGSSSRLAAARARPDKKIGRVVAAVGSSTHRRRRRARGPRAARAPRALVRGCVPTAVSPGGSYVRARPGSPRRLSVLLTPERAIAKPG